MARIRISSALSSAVAFDSVSVSLPRRRRKGGSGKRHRLGRLAGETRRDEVSVLQDITFELEPGESLGILSRKDIEQESILRLAAGTLLPDSGSVQRSMSIVPMIRVAAALGAKYTIRQNIYIVGGLLGLTVDEVREQLPQIASFAGVDQMLDKYLASAPAGTRHRLAWAIATAVPARAFAIHHVLVVGERSFRQQCWTRMDALREDGVSFLLTSDSLKQFRRFCDRAVLVDGGRIVADGAVPEVIADYRALRRPATAESGDSDAGRARDTGDDEGDSVG